MEGGSGFGLGFIFLSTPFSPIRFFCAIFLKLEPDFWPFFGKKRARLLGIFRKKFSVFNPLNFGGLFYTHLYNNYGVVHFVFKAVDSLFVPEDC